MAASFLLPLLVLLFSSFTLFHRITGSDGGDSSSVGNEEFFWEELVLKPLPDRKLVAHFHFRSSTPPSSSLGRHHHLFPKSISQLVQKFHVRELELSFTQGRWNYERWGGEDPMSSNNAKPPGVELWSIFDLPVAEIDPTWKDLTHALSGLFCASINFLESSTAYSTPTWGFPANASNLRYGALPREAVCTENLTPWLKLLPCRDKAGLASLLDRPSVYKAHYHSQRLQIISTKLSGIILDQALTIVLQPDTQIISPTYSTDRSLQPSWSLSSLFKNKVRGKCVLAKESRVFLELDKNLLLALAKKGHEYSHVNAVFELLHAPQKVFREMSTAEAETASIVCEFDVANYGELEALDVGITWKLPLLWSSSQPPFQASRFLMGSGNERGSIAISLQSTYTRELLSSSENECIFQAVIFQVVPWYVRVYYHTVQIFVDGSARTTSDVVGKMKVSPSEDKKSPGTLEMILNFPCDIHSAIMTLDFDKGFLHIDEYPPDANQGFDIPSAIVSFPNLYSSRSYLENSSSEYSPILSKYKERNFVSSYTEVLLVPLTTPDFSMPYNVITFTCTVLALYFGSLLNVLRRRIGEEERLLSRPDSERRGLIPQLLSRLLHKGQKQESTSTSSSSPLIGPKLLTKIVLVAALAMAWHYFFNDS